MKTMVFRPSLLFTKVLEVHPNTELYHFRSQILTAIHLFRELFTTILNTNGFAFVSGINDWGNLGIWQAYPYFLQKVS